MVSELVPIWPFNGARRARTRPFATRETDSHKVARYFSPVQTDVRADDERDEKILAE